MASGNMFSFSWQEKSLRWTEDTEQILSWGWNLLSGALGQVAPASSWPLFAETLRWIDRVSNSSSWRTLKRRPVSEAVFGNCRCCEGPAPFSSAMLNSPVSGLLKHMLAKMLIFAWIQACWQFFKQNQNNNEKLFSTFQIPLEIFSAQSTLTWERGMQWFSKSQQVEAKIGKWLGKSLTEAHILWPTNYTQELNLRKCLEMQTMISMQGYYYKHLFWNLSRVTAPKIRLCGIPPSPMAAMLFSYPNQLPGNHRLEKAELATWPKLGQWEFSSPWSVIIYRFRDGQLFFKWSFNCTWSSKDVYCSIGYDSKSVKHKMCSNAGLIK